MSLDFLVPIGLWGDDATFNRRDKVLVILYFSVLKRLHELDSRFVALTLHYKRIIHMVTQHEVLAALSWSFCLVSVWETSPLRP